MLELGVLDPTPVKAYALRAAGEIAEAILSIDTIIRKRDQDGGAPSAAPR
jgi:chaperonin GroEL (HSP60 family)